MYDDYGTFLGSGVTTQVYAAYGEYDFSGFDHIRGAIHFSKTIEKEEFMKQLTLVHGLKFKSLTSELYSEDECSTFLDLEDEDEEVDADENLWALSEVLRNHHLKSIYYTEKYRKFNFKEEDICFFNASSDLVELGSEYYTGNFFDGENVIEAIRERMSQYKIFYSLSKDFLEREEQLIEALENSFKAIRNMEIEASCFLDISDNQFMWREETLICIDPVNIIPD